MWFMVWGYFLVIFPVISMLAYVISTLYRKYKLKKNKNEKIPNNFVCLSGYRKSKNNSIVMSIDYIETKGNYVLEKTVIYNKNEISEDEVKRIIKSGDYSKYILIMYREQFESVFKSLI